MALRLLVLGAVALDCVPPPPEPLADAPPAVVGEPAATVQDLSAT